MSLRELDYVRLEIQHLERNLRDLRANCLEDISWFSLFRAWKVSSAIRRLRKREFTLLDS